MVVSVLVALPGFAAAETVQHTHPPFAITIPDGFVAQPGENHDDIVLTYRHENVRDAEFALIQVYRMRGVMEREDLTEPAPKDEPPSEREMETKVLALGAPEKQRMAWQSFEIPVTRKPYEAIPGYVAYVARVPLKPNAIQVKVVVAEAREEIGRALLTQLLTTVDGPTNWLTQAERDKSFRAGISKLIATFTLLFIGVLLIIRSRQKARRATMPPVLARPSGKCGNCGLVSAPGSICRRCGAAT